jgi:hypothetical protein
MDREHHCAKIKVFVCKDMKQLCVVKGEMVCSDNGITLIDVFILVLIWTSRNTMHTKGTQ